MAFCPFDIFEIAFVVPKLEDALNQFADAYGYTFAPTAKMLLPMRTPKSESAWRVRYTYSVEAPHLEVVEEDPGTLLVCSPDNTFHHIGAWSDDLAADAARLVAQGMPMVAWSFDERKEPAGLTFHRAPFGGFVELVDRTLERGWLHWIRDGVLPDGHKPGDPDSRATKCAPLRSATASTKRPRSASRPRARVGSRKR
jgi:hypothetical protein